jgi:hypothetical protein
MIMKIRLAKHFILLLLLANFSWAGNPFQPPEQILLFQEVLSQSDENLPTYNMSLSRSGVMHALLNDKFVKEGDAFEGKKVIVVNKKVVVLQSVQGDKTVIVAESLQGQLGELKQVVNEVRQ